MTTDKEKREAFKQLFKDVGPQQIPLGIDTENPIIKDIIEGNKESEHPAIRAAIERANKRSW